jgi:Holliday junction resolvasome RuvABC endonuclease subunit
MTRLAVLQRTPISIKHAVTGSRKASKALMAEALTEAYPEIRTMLEPWPKGRHEHMVDALGAIVACLDDNVVKIGAGR